MLKGGEMSKSLVILLAFSYFSLPVQAKLNVVATIPDIGALVEVVGGSEVNVDTIVKGTQDPHFLEPKPSFMVKVSKADLLVSNGLSLEVGWLPSLIQGGRNPKVNAGAKGNLELGQFAEPIDIPVAAVTRAGGDVHPDGNPHFVIDPIRMGRLGLVIANRLGDLDESHRAGYLERAKALQIQLEEKTKSWKDRVAKTGIKKVITYHNDMAYFLERFGLEAVGYLEPKPGIPPTAQHMLGIINLVKAQNVKLVFVENFFDTKIAERIVADIPAVKVKIVGIAVGSKPDLKTTADVIEQLVSAIEGKP